MNVTIRKPLKEYCKYSLSGGKVNYIDLSRTICSIIKIIANFILNTCKFCHISVTELFRVVEGRRSSLRLGRSKLPIFLNRRMYVYYNE